MIRYTPFFLLTIALLACNDKHLPIDTMAKVVWEINLAEQVQGEHWQENLPYYKDSITAEWQKVLKENAVDELFFKKSLHYYSTDPFLQRSLMDSVISYGNNIANDLQTIITQEENARIAKEKYEEKMEEWAFFLSNIDTTIQKIPITLRKNTYQHSFIQPWKTSAW